MSYSMKKGNELGVRADLRVYYAKFKLSGYNKYILIANLFKDYFSLNDLSQFINDIIL